MSGDGPYSDDQLYRRSGADAVAAAADRAGEVFDDQATHLASRRDYELIRRARNDHAFHPATDVSGPAHAAVRRAASLFASLLIELVPDGRERYLALTKVEEAAMWANAGIARTQPTS